MPCCNVLMAGIELTISFLLLCFDDISHLSVIACLYTGIFWIGNCCLHFASMPLHRSQESCAKSAVQCAARQASHSPAGCVTRCQPAADCEAGLACNAMHINCTTFTSHTPKYWLRKKQGLSIAAFEVWLDIHLPLEECPQLACTCSFPTPHAAF